MEKEVSKTLFENGSVWAVSTSTYMATDKLMAADLDKNAEDVLDIFKLGKKYLMPNDVRLELSGVRAKVQAFMDRFSTPFFLRGVRFVPFKNTLIVKEGLELIRENHRKLGEKFVDDYPTLRNNMISQYPVLESAKWPSKEQILEKFQVKWVVFEINSIGGTETDTNDLLAAKAEFQAELKAEYDKLKAETLKEAHSALIEACDVIAKKIFETGEKFTKATINKPLAIIEKYTMVAELFDLDDIKAKVAELKATLEKVDAKAVRDDWSTAKALGNNLKKMADDLDNLSGYSSDGSVKRKIKFKKEG